MDVDSAEHQIAATTESTRSLLWQLVMLSWPIVVEQILHTFVGLTDTYVANHVKVFDSGLSDIDQATARQTVADAAASINTVTYFFWFFGLIIGALGTGASVLIARATGARHRSLANSVCGQTMAGGAVLGITLMILFWVLADPIARLTRLNPQGVDFTLLYLRIFAPALPFMTLMFLANACLRGAGDTLTPAIVFVGVDLMNMVLTWGLTFGTWGMPELGFRGIAIGTMVAYTLGGIAQIAILIRGRGGIRLHLHRLRPHWHNLKRILRVGIPNGIEGFMQWTVNFLLIIAINGMDHTSTSAAAHGNAVRVEALSYLTAFAIAMATATMVGQSLGRKDPQRAMKVTYLAYALGGGLMTVWGLFFIFFSWIPAGWISADARIGELTARCLFATGFCQPFFAAAMIFGFAMRGAGDTLRVMVYSLGSQIGLRLTGGLLVALVLGWGVVAVWWILAAELTVRGIIMYTRFAAGKWQQVKV